MMMIRLFIFTIFLMASCNTSPTNRMNKKDQVMKNDVVKTTSLPICNEDRSTTGTITNQDGKVIKVIGSYFIKVGDSKRYHPCNLPIAFQEENRNVKFSGEIKEIWDHERLAGSPFMLTSIE